MAKKGRGVDAKLDELAQIMAGGFADTATKVDLEEMRGEMHRDFATKQEFQDGLHTLRGDIDIMLDHHIGTFRKDYDELASRVKKLEQTVFK